jgi:hypothetical protein
MSSERSSRDAVGPDVSDDGSARERNVHPDGLAALLREQFVAQDERVPPDPQLLALARVVTGFVRTSPVPGTSSDAGQRVAARSFVLGACGWWTDERKGQGRVASLIDDAFHQREVPLPDLPAREMLIAIAVGLLRRRGIGPRARGAQLATVDWLAALYLAGSADW